MEIPQDRADQPPPAPQSTTAIPEPSKDILPARSGVFSSGTAIRFTLLVLFIGAGGTWLWWADYSWLWAIAAVPGGGRNDWLTLCPEAVGVDPNRPGSSSIGPPARAFIQSCEARHGIVSPHAWMFAGTTTVFALASLIYFFGPIWRSRRGRLLRIDLQGRDDLSTQLNELVATAGLSRPPRFAIDPRPGAASAVVFGRLGRYTVCLDAGLIASSGTDPGVLRTVVLHELAHIRNRDVDITYLTVALWRSFLLCVVLPHVVLAMYPAFTGPYFPTITEFWRHDWPVLLRSLISAGALTAGTYLARSDILRTREFYADADSAHQTGSTAKDRQHQPVTPEPIVWQRFLDLWKTHPTDAQRSAALEDRANLFAVSSMPMLLTGVTALMADQASSKLLEEFGPSHTILVIEGLPALLSVTLVVAVAGVLLWRAVAYAVLTGRAVPSGRFAGLWLGTGMALGELATFRSTDKNVLLPRHPEAVVLLVVAGAVFAWWTTQSADLWIRRWRGRSLRPVQLLGLTAGLFVFGIWYWYWTGFGWFLLNGIPRGDVPIAPSNPAWFELLTERASGPVAFVGAVVFVMFPLTACLFRPMPQPARWARRAGRRARDRVGPLNVTGLRIAAVGAVAGGVLGCLAVATVSAAVHAGMPVLAELNPTWRMGFYRMWLTLGLTAAVTVTATLTAAIARHRRLTIALAAAGGAALIGLVFLALLAGIDGCDGPLRVMTSTCAWRPKAGWGMATIQVPFVLGLGIQGAAIGALAGAASTDLARRWLPRPPEVDSPAPVPALQPDSMTVRRLTVLAACALTAVLVFGTEQNLWSTMSRWKNTISELSTNTLASSDMPWARQDTIADDVHAWMVVGGGTILTTFDRDLGRNIQTLVAALQSIKDAAGQTATWASPDNGLLRVCKAIVHLPDKAYSFIPIPDYVAQAAWSTVLMDITQAGTDCLQSTQAGHDDDALLKAAVQEVIDAWNTIPILTQRITSDLSR